MDRDDALREYVRAMLPERERYLYDRALGKSRAIMRGMTPEEESEYLKGRAFGNTLWQLRKNDEAYQGFLNGELALDAHRDEFRRLEPMIVSELRHGHAVDLPFLRSVERSRVPLNQARAALRLLEDQAPRKRLEAQAERLAGEVARSVERYLLKGNLSALAPDGGPLVDGLLETTFSKGIPLKIIEAAMGPGAFTRLLRGEIERSHPSLRACGRVLTPSGDTVSEAVGAEAKKGKKLIAQRVGRRFPTPRLRGLLSKNASLNRLQRQNDAAGARERRLKSALIDAMPEHYRDLYPLARAMKRRFILHLGPTNSGKTYEGVGRLKGAKNGIYLGPLRLLAAEQFESLNVSDVPCSLVTGEEQILVPGARVQSSTVEMADLKVHYDVAVIDECQMIGDRDRGGAWTAAILGLCADEIHATASPDAEGLLTRIISECGDDIEIVRHERMTPLSVEKEGFQFPGSVRAGDALIVFSKARVHAVAAELKRRGWRVALIYGALPPDVRRDQAVRFMEGDADVVVSTDAIAMGMNLPIERVVFLESEKYDGDIVRPLTDAEIKQIAGRAGRYGQYEAGWVNAFGFKGVVARALGKPLLPLTEAVIGFPESLLGIPLPLTKIIDQWLSMKDKGCFSKASAVRMATLAAMLETPRTDKALLYRFLCIPFDETDPDLLARWRAMYQAECRREHVDVVSELPHFVDPEGCTVEMLDDLEADYRRCDLYYNYARLFLKDPEPVMQEIQRRKSLISGGIIHILSTQKLKQRACPGCNAVLPWNWPYRLCDNCHERQRWRS